MKVHYSRIFFWEMITEEKKVLDFDLIGPFKEFTVQQNLEKGWVSVFGKDQKGHFQIAFKPKDRSIHLVVEKIRGKTLLISFEKSTKELHEKEELDLHIPVLKKEDVFERLSLGSHKKQDWDFVRRRDNLSEILPFWFHLSQFYEKSKRKHQEGVARLLDDTPKEDALHKLLHAGFSGILVPSLKDKNYQNIIQEKDVSKEADPFILIQEGGEKIRSLFFKQNENELMILPELPSKFICGRFINIKVKNIGMMDLEWTKRKLRRVVIRSDQRKTVFLKLPKGYKDFRLRTSQKDDGKIYSISDPIFLQKNTIYYFDRFQR